MLRNGALAVWLPISGYTRSAQVRVQQVDKKMKFRKEKTVASNWYYLIGLTCLIPFLGAIMGGYFIVFGLFRKDLWFVVMGIIGVIITVMVYSNQSEKEDIKNGFLNTVRSISQTDLEYLVKDIEMYKIENGQYPDSLEQLLTMNHNAHIIDFVQKAISKRVSYFNYSRHGNKYMIFSSGEDGIPNTLDDILPQITIKENSKIGLMKMERNPDTSYVRKLFKKYSR
jgi:hypothetical protein